MSSSSAIVDRRRSSSSHFYNDFILPWDRFHCWLHCVCIVTFDLEIGQTIELILPKHAKLTEKEKSNICYLAFPDSNSGCMGDTKFYFRIRCYSQLDKQTSDFITKYNQSAPNALAIDPDYLFGYVYFRQVRDKSMCRGYLQKSVVVMSRFPFVNLFILTVKRIAPQYFSFGLAGLESACNDVDHWPLPEPGAILSLPLLGSVMQIRLPSRFDKYESTDIIHQKADRLSASTHLLPSVHEPNLYEHLSPILYHLHLLWELVLLGEPLAIIAPSPAVCSNVVHCLISLILPLRYGFDYRPFFTIHDSEFKEFTSNASEAPNVIIGVTNPFFAKMLETWPNVIRIGEKTSVLGCSSEKSSPSSSCKVKKSGDLRSLCSKPGLYSKYKSLLSKDKTMLKRILKGVDSRRPSEVQSAIIKRHFYDVTQSFLIPLERYLASLMPLQKSISPWKSPPKLKDFDVEEFLLTLESSGPQLTSGVKGDWIGLYRQFFQCENFKCWLSQRHREIDQKLQMLHLEVLCTSTLSNLSAKPEIEVVDLVIKIKDKLKFVDENADKVGIHLKTALLKRYDAILGSLPDDLKAVLTAERMND